MDHFEQINAMSKEDRENILDPICEALRGKRKIYGNMEVLANREFALRVLDLYEEWQQEVFDRL